MTLLGGSKSEESHIVRVRDADGRTVNLKSTATAEASTLDFNFHHDVSGKAAVLAALVQIERVQTPVYREGRYLDLDLDLDLDCGERLITRSGGR